MNPQPSGFAGRAAEYCGCEWMGSADPGWNIAVFAESQVRWIAAPAQLRGTASATRMQLVLGSRARRSSDRADPSGPLERVAETIAVKLGAQAAERLKRLATFADGWDQGYGRALTEDTLLGLERLLALADFADLDVALFLSRDGHLLLNWPDGNGELVELDIARDTLMCFIASTGDELELPIEPRAVTDLMTRVR
ncbi:MAG: hypothetical protein KFB96_06690 [Thiocapsa sp.]|uniref:hypothetical protein n=1 Tax=Thiocapsa sp. TaxID=2024551 RepID=UPI001BCE4948|nr:hypothetical protein [Thiocapsa sp.]QVL50147.1 MAG: hypothetical protein KFB96_06690 [Thiocapsa sp.]